MPKASPSKAPLPKKPREPKKVKDVALNTMRVADYQAKLAVYEEEMAAYKEGQRERKADKRSAKQRLSASDAEPAAKRPTPVPSSCLLRVAARPHSTQPGAALRSPSPPPHLPSESGAAGDARGVRGGLSRGAARATRRAPAAIAASPSRREGGGGGGAAAAMRRRRAEQGAVLPRMRPHCH